MLFGLLATDVEGILVTGSFDVLYLESLAAELKASSAS